MSLTTFANKKMKEKRCGNKERKRRTTIKEPAAVTIIGGASRENVYFRTVSRRRKRKRPSKGV